VFFEALTVGEGLPDRPAGGYLFCEGQWDAAVASLAARLVRARCRAGLQRERSTMPIGSEPAVVIERPRAARALVGPEPEQAGVARIWRAVRPRPGSSR